METQSKNHRYTPCNHACDKTCQKCCNPPCKKECNDVKPVCDPCLTVNKCDEVVKPRRPLQCIIVRHVEEEPEECSSDSDCYESSSCSDSESSSSDDENCCYKKPCDLPVKCCGLSDCEQDSVLCQKRLYFNQLECVYKHNGTISWSTFNSNQLLYQRKEVVITQKDVKYGTLRIKYPCMITLCEDICFNPNADKDWYPDASKPNNNELYINDITVSSVYEKGFFAVLTVEAEDVIINLNHKRIEQSKEHALQQRSFSVIQLNNQPTNPAITPTTSVSATNVCIKKGTVGRTSQYGVNGYKNNNVFIDAVTVTDFEETGINLNEADNVCLYDVIVECSRNDVPVNSLYAVARGNKKFAEKLLKMEFSPGSDVIKQLLITQLAVLKELMLETYYAVSNNKHVKCIPSVFRNECGLPEGNCYGVFINSATSDAKGFLEQTPASYSDNITLQKCRVKNICAKVKEIVTIDTGNNSLTPQVDVCGFLFQFLNSSRFTNDRYFYNNNPVSDVQLTIANIQLNNNVPTAFSTFGPLNITQTVINWRNIVPPAYFEADPNFKLRLYNNNGSSASSTLYTPLCNSDYKFNVLKGAIGVRFDGLKNTNVKRLSVYDVYNKGLNGSLICGGYTMGNPNQGSMIGYTGGFARGVIVSASTGTNMACTTIKNIFSSASSATGLTLHNNTTLTNLDKFYVANVTADKDGKYKDTGLLPNTPPIERDIYIP